MWNDLHFTPRPLMVLIGDSITQYASDDAHNGNPKTDGPGWGSALQVCRLSVMHVFSFLCVACNGKN